MRCQKIQCLVRPRFLVQNSWFLCALTWQKVSGSSLGPFFLFFKKKKKKILFIYLLREGKGEREEEKYQCVVASHAPPTGDLSGPFLTIPFMRAPHSWPNHLPRAPLPNNIISGIRFEHMTLGGEYKLSAYSRCFGLSYCQRTVK